MYKRNNLTKAGDWRHHMARVMNEPTINGADVLAATLGRWFLWRFGLKRGQKVGPWQPTFVSRKRKLIIEVEREIEIPKNDLFRQSKYFDEQESRDWNLYHKGWSIYRWHDKDIIANPNECAAKIKAWAKSPIEHRPLE